MLSDARLRTKENKKDDAGVTTTAGKCVEGRGMERDAKIRRKQQATMFVIFLVALGGSEQSSLALKYAN